MLFLFALKLYQTKGATDLGISPNISRAEICADLHARTNVHPRSDCSPAFCDKFTTRKFSTTTV